MANKTPFFYIIIIATLLFVLSSHPCSNASAMDCNENDRQTLLKIKEALASPTPLFDWIPKTNCCTWSGVQCNDAGRVNSLYIDVTILSAKVLIPSAIGDLPALRSFSTGNAPFYGPIPPSFAKLSQLHSLTIYNTLVSGPIPDFRDSNLTYINLSSNKFYGPIPRSFGTVLNLEQLDLSGNQLTGSIPPGLFHRSKIGTTLRLNLANNYLTGEVPEMLANGSFDVIDLSHNNLTGSAAQFLSAPRMAPPQGIPLSIYLQWNRLRFDFTSVTLSPNISAFDLSHNRIWGSIPESVNGMTKLYGLSVANNKLCGKIPPGEVTAKLSAESFANNTCICGMPLPPCAY